MAQVQRVTAKGIIYKNGCVFMLKDQKGNWELPGGRVDFGEHPEEALKREFGEELGVSEMKIGELINAWSFTSTARGDDYHFILLVYRCEADLDKIAISDEHQEYAWVPTTGIDTYQMRDGYRQSIKRFLELA